MEIKVVFFFSDLIFKHIAFGGACKISVHAFWCPPISHGRIQDGSKYVVLFLLKRSFYDLGLDYTPKLHIHNL